MDLENFLKFYLIKRVKLRNRKKKLFLKCLSEIRKKIHKDVYAASSMLQKIIFSRQPFVRSCETFSRDDTQWTFIMLQKYSEDEWMSDFRVSKATFVSLCDMLRSYLEPKTNFIKDNPKTASVEKQVAIALFKLASCAEYRVIGEVFGFHKSTVKKILYKVVNAIVSYIMPKVIYMPKKEEAEEISSYFKAKCCLPQITGCIDGTHVSIIPPSNGRKDFVNRKGGESIILQAVVDHRTCFRDISCKYPGSVHDASVFKGSTLYCNHDMLIPKEYKDIAGKEISFYIIGDPAYPLLPWLMKDYVGRNLPSDEENFNVCLNKARVKVEIAFGHLKNRWRILSKKCDIDYSFMPKIVAACCTLHNVIKYSEENTCKERNEDLACDDQPEREQIYVERATPLAIEIRDHLKEYLKISHGER